MAEDYSDAQRTFMRWQSEIDYAQKDEKYKRWLLHGDRIIRRYRDERKEGKEAGRRRYNILWSNVQTLEPAVYGKMPKPIAERRFLDRDPTARLASLMLERTLAFQMDTCGFHAATAKAVKDQLLPGMGQVWLRYAPEFESQKVLSENKVEESAEDESGETAEDEADEGDGEPIEKLSFERVCFDYVFYRDFLWGPSRCWDEVPWVARRSWLDKSEAIEAFGEEIADQMVFGDPKNKEWANTDAGEQIQLGKSKKAEVWEIWEKATRCVYFIAPDTVGVVLKTEEDDPLKLEGFWPCPEPLFSTQTNDTLIPVPDYVEYQDQAAELDTLTQRISVVTSAIRANGTYNSEFPALQRLFQDGQDNKLIPVDQWAAFAEKGGMKGAIDLVPMDMIVQVLNELYAARDHVIQDIYQITGMSDIVRGESDPNETLGAQKIKSHFATGRLGSRQQQVAEFCASLVKIAAEIISEVFSPESLALMSGVDQMNKEAVRKAVEAVPQPKPPQPQPGQPPQPPVDPQQLQMQFQQMQQQAAQQAMQKAQQDFQAAVKLLKDDKLRGFRVDIETDSTIADDMGEDKGLATEFVSSVFQSFEAAGPVIAQAPEMAKPVGEMLLWAMRKFRVGRTLEAAFESAMDELDERVQQMKNQPPQPSPDMIKAQSQAELAQVKGQAVQQKAQSDLQISQMTAAAEDARSKADIQVQTIQLQSDQAQQKLNSQIEGLRLQLEQAQSAAKNQTDLKGRYITYLQAVRVAEIAAGVKTDESQVEAKIELALGFANMAHEKEMQAADHAQQQDMAASQQAHDQTMQENAPKPASPSK